MDRLAAVIHERTAICLYQRAGFMKTGEIPDLFRIDGLSLSCTGMTRCLRERSA